MRVGFWASPSSLWFEGGAKWQILKTKEYLSKKGIEVVLLDTWHGLEQHFDIIHCFGGLDTLTVLEIAKARNIPTVLFLFLSTYQIALRPLWEKVRTMVDNLLPVTTMNKHMRQMVSIADVIVVLSQEHKHLVVEKWSVNPEKVRICHLGIEAERFVNAKPEPFIEKYGLKDFVLEVATIRPLKGQLDLIRALDGTGLDLVFIGPLIDAVKSRKHVHWLGPLSHDDPLLPAAFAAARVHALPSYREGFPLVNLEAAAAGCAIVTSPLLGLREYLESKYYICKPGNISHIRKTILEAYKNGRNECGRDRFVSFDLDIITSGLISLYKEVLKT
jgi:glycosyltransferase involved in cell wall biosynthesis